LGRRKQDTLTLISTLLLTSLACTCSLCALPAGPASQPEPAPTVVSPPTSAPPPATSTSPELNWYLPLMAGPGIARAEGRFRIIAERSVLTPRLLIPLPLHFEDQVPLTFTLSVDPDHALQQVEWVSRDAHNWAVELTLQPMERGDAVRITWASDLLVRDHDYSALPGQAAIPAPDALPADVQPWLEATAGVQANHPEIEAVAAQLRGDGEAMGLARRVADFTANQPFGDFQSLDALEALREGGSCTSMANLAAALLRANGIPARVLAIYPTDGEWYQTHYIVEFYLPEAGWVWMESTVGQIPWPPYAGVVVALATPEDENRAFEANRWVIPGAPWGSLTENLTGDLSLWSEGEMPDNCDHAAHTVHIFTDSNRMEQAFSLAEQVWQTELQLRLAGEENAEAQVHREAAAGARTPDELIDHLQQAARCYSGE